jgi:hypothetical protein
MLRFFCSRFLVALKYITSCYRLYSVFLLNTKHERIVDWNTIILFMLSRCSRMMSLVVDHDTALAR